MKLIGYLIALTACGIVPTFALPQSGDGSCTNTPRTRQCWDNGFSVSTNMEQKWPDTGQVVKYDFEITNVTLSPDGIPKRMLVVNGQYPGPTITANWGDTIKVKVTNSLTNNGTSLHWHGFRQLNTNSEDGADGVTECPIPPGESRTYKFVATQHGSSWYHSHFTNQYGDGVVGPIVIKGPATASYDEDLGALLITDLYNISMYQASLFSRRGIVPFAANGLINGLNKSPDKSAGAYYTQFLTPGKKYRLRLINGAVANNVRLQLDSHKFKVIQADFVPITPYDTDSISIKIGQRYDVVFTASSTPGNYWFRAKAPTGCVVNNNNDGIRAIFSVGVTSAEPNSTASPFVDNCADESGLVPWVKDNVPRELFDLADPASNMTVGLVPPPVVKWSLTGTPMHLDLLNPTLSYIASKNLTPFSTTPSLQVYTIPTTKTWHFLLLTNTRPAAHPLHLHGHDFRILGQGLGTFKASDVGGLVFENPMRRDTISMPGSAWLVLAWKLDNPGAWLLHCHTIWHLPEGMGVQFLERPNDIKKVMDLDYLKPECKKWKKWFERESPPIDPPV